MKNEKDVVIGAIIYEGTGFPINYDDELKEPYFLDESTAMSTALIDIIDGKENVEVVTDSVLEGLVKGSFGDGVMGVIYQKKRIILLYVNDAGSISYRNSTLFKFEPTSEAKVVVTETSDVIDEDDE